MTTLTLQLDSEALREATAQAILGQLTPEVKAKLMAEAVKAVLQPGTSSWDRGMSPLQAAFNSAVHQVANAEARRLMTENTELAARMNALMVDVAAKMLATDPDKLAERMATAFVESMRER